MISRIIRIKNSNKIRHNIKYSNKNLDTEVSASNIKVKEHLKDLENELNREINHINQMSMRISEIVTLYDNTEKVIVEKKIYSDRKGGTGIYRTRDDGDIRKSEKEQNWGERFVKELEDSWKDAGKTLKSIEKWRKSKSGEEVETLYDIIDLFSGKDSPLGEYKTAYDIMKDIISGEVDIETGKKLIKEIGGAEVDSVVEVLDMILNEESFLNRRSDILEEKGIEALKNLELNATLYYILAEGTEIGAKSILKVGGDLIVGTLKLDTINATMKCITGEDYGEKIYEFNEGISDLVSKAVDAGGEAVEKYDRIYKSIAKMYFSDIKNII